MTALHGFEDLTLPDVALRAGDDRLRSGSTSPDIDPCSAETFEEIPIATAGDVDQIVEVAWQAFKAPGRRDLNPLARERLMHRLADAMEADRPRLAALEALDTGKPVAIVDAVDIPAAISWLRAYAGWPSNTAGRAGTLAATPGSYHVYSRRDAA